MYIKLGRAFCAAIILSFWGVCAFPIQLFAQKGEPEAKVVFKGISAREFALSPGERYLAAAGYEVGQVGRVGLVLVWDLKTEKEVFRHRNPEGGATTISFSPDGKLLAAAGVASFKTAKVWEFPSGKEIARLEHSDGLNSLRFSADGKRIATASGYLEQEGASVISFWDTKTFKKEGALRTAATNIWTFDFSPDGKYLACGDDGGRIHLWNLKDNKIVLAWRESHSFVKSVRFSKDSKVLVSGGSDERIRIYDPADPEQPPTVLRGQDGGIWFVSLSADGRWLFSYGNERPPFKDFGGMGCLQVWNLAEKKLHATIKNASWHVSLTAVSRDGQMFVTGNEDDTVTVWRLPKEFYKPTAK